MNKRKSLTMVLLTLALTCALCLWLYRADNKYSRQEDQSISGVFVYDGTPAWTSLIRQWVIYPEVLLTPETVQEYAGYRCYGDIGGQRPQETGSLTYRLTLLLPETPAEYALEVPEIFSACKLYLDGRLLLQLGEPETAGYREALQSRLLCFTGGGRMELLIAVSDFSGVNLGMTYPPAFGTAEAVLRVREVRLLLHGGLALLAVLGALMALSFGRGRNRVLGCLLCLCFAAVTGYPLYHGLFATAVQPWYTLEPVCYYGLLLLALLLQCSLYGMEVRPCLLLTAPCVAGLAATVLCFGGAAVLPDGTAAVFSAVAAVLKAYTAVCLLVTSVWALMREKAHSPLLLSGAAALAVCLIWDRLLPLYEPIYGGWFGEIGGGLLVISLGAALWQEAVDAYRFRLTHEDSIRQMQRLLSMQKDHYAQLSRQIQLTRHASHDLRHHMRALRGLASQQQWERLQQYLEEYEPHLEGNTVKIWSEHPAANALLSHYAQAVEGKGVSYDVRLTIPPELPIPDDELCVILGNLMENAVDAVLSQTSGPKRIYLRGEAAKNQLRMVLDNTFSGELRQRDGVYLSGKHPGPALGIRSADTIVRKYGGLMDCTARPGLFQVSLLLPMPVSHKRK